MNGREANNKAAPSADLLVCFPSRAHLTLMPKPLCSPARPSDQTNKRHHNHRHHRGHGQLKRSSTRGGVQDSPLLWSKTKPMGSEISEPTSPKVTCAGQIKVRSKTSSCNNSWQSVMEEVERIHIKGKHKKKHSWVEALGLKKDVMQFFTCLRSIRFDCRCFGTFRKSDITTEDEDGEEEGDYQENHVGFEGSDGNHEDPRTAFSKWFVVLQENQNNMLCKEDEEKEIERPSDDECIINAAPPPNALLLMRCRSAPAKGWLEEKEEDQIRHEEEEDEDEDERGTGKGERKAKSLKCSMEGEKRTKKENMLVMKYDTDFYKISSDVAKETWIAGGVRSDPISRSRSWKR